MVPSETHSSQRIQVLLRADIQGPTDSRVEGTAWARVSRGVTPLARQTGEFEPHIEGVEVVSVNEGTTVAPSQPEISRPGIARPFPACSQLPPPTPTDRLHPGQPEIARPCIKRPSASQLSASRSNKPLLTLGTSAVGSWYKKDNSDPPGIAVGERRWYVVWDTAKDTHTSQRCSPGACPGKSVMEKVRKSVRTSIRT